MVLNGIKIQIGNKNLIFSTFIMFANWKICIVDIFFTIIVSELSMPITTVKRYNECLLWRLTFDNYALGVNEKEKKTSYFGLKTVCLH